MSAETNEKQEKSALAVAAPKTVFAIGCHPDDIEFTMAGTLALLKARGCSIHYMSIANGSWGSATMRRFETIRTRRDEGAAAAAFLGATF
ncbi:MAG: PIG-L family deacetylase, partial [Thermoguttaceae bacterium]|nr:PIG-L family deacetylase [Thermoguttaceae bacterium]